MKRWLLPFVLMALAVATATAWAQTVRPLPPLTLRVTTRARAVRQGEVVLATVTPSRPIATIDADAFAASIGFWPTADGRTWQGLVGIPVDAEVGRRELVIRATTADHISGVVRFPLQVTKAAFATRKLTVAPEFVDPPASEIDRILAEQKQLETLFLTTRPGRLWNGSWALPVPGTPTSSFGRQTILNGMPRGRHQGADFRAGSGTPIHAPNAGEVVLAEPLYFSGNTVIVDHGDGLYSLFAHLSKTSVAAGAHVARGDLLGQVGATGRVTGPHLHWAVRLHNVSVDPLSLVYAAARIDGPR
jgi:murein DD-endopeptidase MepM/ murein hydrolase activator NlpD